jgi:hypothetical protein
MKERHTARYDIQLLPKSLRKVTISWSVDAIIESDVINFSALGMNVVINPSLKTDIPKKNDTIKIKLPIVQVWLTGICIYVNDLFDGTFSIGIYFCVPVEQNYINKILSKELDVPLQTCSFVKHEWEELVTYLCNSDDPRLQKIGYDEWKLLGHYEKS